VNNDSPMKAFLVVLVVALVCSSLVSAAVVILRPIQLNNQLLERSKAAHATDKLDTLIPAQISDAENRRQQIVGKQAHIQTRDRIAVADKLGPYREVKPVARDI